MEPGHRLGDVVGSEHTGAATRYGREELGRGARSVGDVLDRGVGTEVRTIGAPGSFSSVRLRGADSDQVAIYLDGLLLNEAIGGGVDLSELELAHVDAIEVYRGISPVQFGYGVPGGTVNIRLPRPGHGPPWRAQAEAGSFGHRAVSALGRRGWGGWSALGAAAARGADNDFELPPEDGGERRRNADFEQRSAFLKLDRRLGDGRNVDGFARYFHKEQGLPRWDNQPAETRLETEVVQARGRWRREGAGGSPWGISTEVYTRHKDEVYDDRDGDVGLGAQHNRYRTWSGGVGGYAEYVGAANTVSARADLRREDFLGEDLAGSAPDSEAERASADIVAGNNAHLLDDRLLLGLALRYRTVRDEGETRSTGIGSGMERRDAANSWATPTVGLRYRLGAHTALRANFGEYVRTPSFNELFGDRGFVRGNPDLEAETGVNRDIGIEWSAHWRRDWLPALRMDLSYFHNSVEDAIVRTFDSRGVGRSENLAEAEIRGVEAEAGAALVEGLRLDLRATIQDTEHVSSLVAFDGKQLPGRAERRYGATLNWARGSWEWHYSVDVEESMYFDTANLLPAEDRTRHDIAIKRRFNGVEVETSVRNLTDERYEDFRGHPRPGRSWHLTVSYAPGNY